ncbi:MAG: hypothetical protein Q8R39_01000 [bacterium]|nr:hypothetical protein [bacterium]MDZ4285063.1 hypothetical protein [Patescibacteria group bacterium]
MSFLSSGFFNTAFVRRVLAGVMVVALLMVSAVPLSVIAEDGGGDVVATEATLGERGTDGTDGTDGADGRDRGERGTRDGSDGEDGGTGEGGEDGSGDESGTEGTSPGDGTSGEDGTGTEETPDGADGTSSSDTGNQSTSGEGDTSITTGAATAVTDVTTKGNVNSTDTEALSEDGSGNIDGSGSANGGGGGTTDSGSETPPAADDAADDADAHTRDDRRDSKVLDKRPRDSATTTSLETIIESENDITVANENETLASSGLNSAGGSGSVSVTTGTSTAFANILNAVNVNLVNSSGLMLFFNSLFGSLGTLDLRTALGGDDALIGGGIFGEREPSIGTCTFSGCAGDVSTRIYASSTARILNDIIVRSIAGQNVATTSGELARIDSGDALAGANVVNVANTNIVNSNYLLLALNAFGDWAGDLVFPNGDFFKQIFGGGARGSGDIEEDEEGSEAHSLVASTTIASTNTAGVENELDVDARSGGNAATSTLGSAEIETGSSAALSQVVNRLNQNIIGGNSMLVLLQIHGDWAGNLFNVPEGILWERTPGGVAIWNDPNYAGGAVGAGTSGSSEGEEGSLGVIEDALVPLSELTVSRGDREARRAARDASDEERRGTTTTEILHQNVAEIANNVKVLALTGENRAQSVGDSLITSGNALAAANILNIANTNVIGANWMLALVNIFGDWSGNLSFGEPDLWIGTTVDAPRSPLEAGDELTYHFTVANRGDARASNVWLNARATGDLIAFDRSFTDSLGDAHFYLGTLAPGDVRELSLTGHLDTPLPFGRHTIDHTFAIASYEPETNRADNTETLSLFAFGGEAPATGSSTGSGESGSGAGSGSGESGSGAGSGGSDVSAGGGSSDESAGGGSGSGGSDGGIGTGDTNSGGNTGSTGGSSGGSQSGSGGASSGGSGGGGGGIYYTPPADLEIEKRNGATSPVPAGSSVDYTVVIQNDGLGEAYHAVLVDVLKDKDGTVIHEESWSLETIYPSEEVTVKYTIEFSLNTAPGTYTNSAYVKAYDGHPSLDPFYGSAADSPTVTSTVEISSASVSSGSSGTGGGGANTTTTNTTNTNSTGTTPPPAAPVPLSQNETASSTSATTSSTPTTTPRATSFRATAIAAAPAPTNPIAAALSPFSPALLGATLPAPSGTPAFEDFEDSGAARAAVRESGIARERILPTLSSTGAEPASETSGALTSRDEGSLTPLSGLAHAAAAFLASLPIPASIFLPIFLLVLVLVGMLLFTRPSGARA